ATRTDAERAVEAARREAATVGAQLAAVNQFLRTAAGPASASTLAADLQVDPGYELAVAAVLGPRLGATVVADFGSAVRARANSGNEGGSVLVAGGEPPEGGMPDARWSTSETPPSSPAGPSGFDSLAGHVHGSTAAEHLLRNVWVTDDLSALPADFTGTAVTETGTVWFSGARELRQVPTGGEDRVLAERNRRDELIAATERAAAGERAALAAAQSAPEVADRGLREAQRTRDQAAEAERRAAWLVQQRRESPDEGPGAVRRAEVLGELAAERRLADQAARERAARCRPPALRWTTGCARSTPSWPPTARPPTSSPPTCAPTPSARPRSTPACASAA